jgi:hypothetical protein
VLACLFFSSSLLSSSMLMFETVNSPTTILLHFAQKAGGVVAQCCSVQGYWTASGY